jgi:hypothetical protein
VRQYKLRMFIMLLLVPCLLAPGGALAYSYGDPNKEDVAESFKEIVVVLNRSPIDWSKADAIYKTRRAEISAHFGEDVAVTLDVNLSNKDKESFIANYKAVLVMNLKRRFDYSLKDFGDYAKAKLLVAKAKGTYDVLKPYIPADQTDALDTAFVKAYEALGNPGLFGVGEKPSDEAAFKQQIKIIMDAVTPLFPYTKASAVIVEQEPRKPASPQPTKSDPSPAPAKELATDESSAAVVEENPSTIEPAATVTEPEQPDDAVQETTEDPDIQEEEQNTEVDNKSTDTEVAIEHAPMERTKKTNPVISIIIIAAVIGLIGTTLWILRRKKLI